MNNYISREEAIKRINGICVTDDIHGMAMREGIERAVGVIYRLPAADVALVRRSEWLERTDGEEGFICKNCHGGYTLEDETPFCSNCGAKMGEG